MLSVAPGRVDESGGAASVRLAIADRLAEEAVLRAIARRPGAEGRRFHQERDPIYTVPDPDEREARFRRLHARWFRRLELARPLEQALGEQPSLAARVRGCLVVPAHDPNDEHADLYGTEGPPTIVIQLRPGSLLEPDALLGLLRHELQHVADMLDPEFGYDRALPAFAEGPSYDLLVRRRYHTVWDATIDGRLSRRGVLPAGVRAERLAEFLRTFPMLGEAAESAFARWFEDERPTHRALLEFVLAAAENHTETLGPSVVRCPVCRFPTTSSAVIRAGLAEAVGQAVQARHPHWRPELGLCRQCADLYAARVAGASAATPPL